MSEPKPSQAASMRSLLDAKGVPQDDEVGSIAVAVAGMVDKADAILDRVSIGRTPEAEERFASKVTDAILGRFGVKFTKFQQWIILRYVIYAALILAGSNAITGTALYTIGRTASVATQLGPVSPASIAIVQANGGLDAIMAQCKGFTPKAGGEACDLPNVWITPPQVGGR